MCIGRPLTSEGQLPGLVIGRTLIKEEHLPGDLLLSVIGRSLRQKGCPPVPICRGPTALHDKIYTGKQTLLLESMNMQDSFSVMPCHSTCPVSLLLPLHFYFTFCFAPLAVHSTFLLFLLTVYAVSLHHH